MNKKLLTIGITIAVIIIIMIATGPLYILEEGTQAVVVRIGKIVKTEQEAGLKLKMPFIDTVVRYSKKILSWDGDAQRIPTQENLFIWVDATARWKITDPVKFYESIITMQSATARLNDVIDSSVRTIISKNFLREAVRNTNLINEMSTIPVAITEDIGGEDTMMQKELQELTSSEVSTRLESIEKGRENLSNEIFDAASAITPQYGITLIDIIIRQISYSDDLTESVHNRMIKDRNQEAQKYRSYGEGQKQKWLGSLENEQKTILSGAGRTAEEIKGIADAEATRIYASSYSQDLDFFEFWRSIESYKKTLPNFGKTITTDMEYFKYLDSQNPR